MNRLRVASIEWLSREAGEAVLLLQSEQHSFLAFSHPFAGFEGDTVEHLFALGVSNLRTTHDECEAVVSRANGFCCTVWAIVVSITPPVVCISGTLVELDVPMPGDTQPGIWLEFACERLQQ